MKKIPTMEECVEAINGAIAASLLAMPVQGRRVGDFTDAVLRAIEASGFVLVPKEATEEMAARGGDAVFDVYEGYNAETKRRMRMLSSTCEPTARRAWSAMIAASPGAKTE